MCEPRRTTLARSFVPLQSGIRARAWSDWYAIAGSVWVCAWLFGCAVLPTNTELLGSMTGKRWASVSLLLQLLHACSLSLSLIISLFIYLCYFILFFWLTNNGKILYNNGFNEFNARFVFRWKHRGRIWLLSWTFDVMTHVTWQRHNDDTYVKMCLPTDTVTRRFLRLELSKDYSWKR